MDHSGNRCHVVGDFYDFIHELYDVLIYVRNRALFQLDGGIEGEGVFGVFVCNGFQYRSGEVQ